MKKSNNIYTQLICIAIFLLGVITILIPNPILGRGSYFHSDGVSIAVYTITFMMIIGLTYSREWSLFKKATLVFGLIYILLFLVGTLILIYSPIKMYSDKGTSVYTTIGWQFRAPIEVNDATNKLNLVLGSAFIVMSCCAFIYHRKNKINM